MIQFKYRIPALLASAVLLMAACSSDDEEVIEPELPVDDPVLEILTDFPTEVHTFSFSSTDNKAKTLYFNTNRDWHVEMLAEPAEYEDWLAVFETEGEAADSARLWVAVAENPTYEPRRVQFNLVSEDNIETFTVYQAHKDAVVFTDPKAYENLSREEQIIPIEFAYNTDSYSVKASASWIEQTEAPSEAKTRAMVSNTVWFRVKANNTFDLRRSVITITSKDAAGKDIEATMNVYQAGIDKPIISVLNKEAFAGLSSSEHTIPVSLSTVNVADVTSQLTVDIPAADSSWVSFEKNAAGDGFIIHVKENIHGPRKSVIAVCAVADHKVNDEIEVSQAAADGVTVTITNRDVQPETLDKLGGSLLVKYTTADGSWDAKIVDADGNTPDWIRIANRSNPGQLAIAYDANTKLRPRTAVLKVFPAGKEDKSDNLDMTQAAGTTVVLNGSLKSTLEAHVADGIWKSLGSITSLELKGELADADWKLLKEMVTSGKGYKLTSLDLSQITNTTLPSGALSDGTQLKTIVMPGVETLPEKFCNNCTALTSLVVSEGTAFIEQNAFGKCTSLEKVWLPSTMKYLHGESFSNCNAITEFHLKTLPLQIGYCAKWSPEQLKTNTQSFNNVFSWGVDPRKTILYMPSAYVKYYRTLDPQHVISYYLQDKLDAMTTTSDDWVNATPQDGFKPDKKLKDLFNWANAATTIIEE